MGTAENVHASTIGLCTIATIGTFDLIRAPDVPFVVSDRTRATGLEQPGWRNRVQLVAIGVGIDNR